jgi:hypothetical protein
MLSTFVESAPMRDLFERTIRHVPTGRFEATLQVRPRGSHSTVIQRATEYLIRNLIGRMSVEDGTDLLVGKLPAEARVRQAFPVLRFRPYLKDWCDHVNEARAVFKEFTDGGDVGRSRMATACQSMALLEILLQGDVIASAHLRSRKAECHRQCRPADDLGRARSAGAAGPSFVRNPPPPVCPCR